MTPRLSRRPHYHGLSNVEHYGVVYDIVTRAGDLVGRVHHNGDGWQLRWSITCPYCGAQLGDLSLGVTRPRISRSRKSGSYRVHADIEARLLSGIRARLATTPHGDAWMHSIPDGTAMYARLSGAGGSARARRRTLRASQRAARRILAALTTP
jgi:hypothetical protein